MLECWLNWNVVNLLENVNFDSSNCFVLVVVCLFISDMLLTNYTLSNGYLAYNVDKCV